MSGELELWQRVDAQEDAGPFEFFVYSGGLGGIERWFDNEEEARAYWVEVTAEPTAAATRAAPKEGDKRGALGHEPRTR